MDILSDNINAFNEAVVTASEKLSKSPEVFSPGLYNMVVNVNNALVPLSMALLMTYYIFSFYEKAVTFKMNDYKQIGTGVINFTLGAVLLKSNIGILNIFYYVSNTILKKITVTNSSAILIDPAVIEGLWEGVSFWDGVGTFFEMFFCQIVLVIILFVANFIISFVVISRMFEIYIYMAFAPLAMCSFVSDTTRGIFKGYITNYCALVLKSAIIVLILRMYQTYMADNMLTMTESGAGYFWNSCIAGLLIITLIIGAEKISKTIVGTLK